MESNFPQELFTRLFVASTGISQRQILTIVLIFWTKLSKGMLSNIFAKLRFGNKRQTYMFALSLD